MLEHSCHGAIALIPYIRLPRLGSIPPFGILAVAGIIAAARVAGWRARKLGIDKGQFDLLVLWTGISGFLLAHVVSEVVYFPQRVLTDPWRLLQVHRGLSSFGGFFGAIAGLVFHAWRRKMPIWQCADAMAYGLPVGWLFGRMGCSIVHDHPGRLSDSFLAVAYPGGPRLDLGLLELLLTPILVIAVVLVGRRTRRPGAILMTLTLLYPLLRFPLDFLRAPPSEGGDVRYLGLTPGHYAAIALFSFGLLLWWRMRRLAEPDRGQSRAGRASGSAIHLR